MSNLETRLESLENQVHGASLTQAGRTLDQIGLFYYILAGISALFACFPMIHVAVGLMVMFAPARPGDPHPMAFGAMFVVLGSMFILLGWTYAFFLFLAGKNLKARTRPTLVTVMACLSCINMPFGTALGIYTLIEMNKPEVRNLFKQPI